MDILILVIVFVLVFNNRLVIQFGRTQLNDGVAYIVTTFPITYSNMCYSIIIQQYDDKSINTSSGTSCGYFQVCNKTTSSFQWRSHSGIGYKQRLFISIGC